MSERGNNVVNNRRARRKALMSIGVTVVGGLSGGEYPLGQLLMTPQEIQQACGLFGSAYILRMGLHYQRYVIGGYLPRWRVVSDIYKAANPAPELTTKIRASSVSGNIGESVLALVVRRLLGATQALDVLPINVTPEAKCPDFRIQIRPGFPAAFQAVTGLTPRIEFDYWPAESKAVQSQGRARTVVKNALTQLGSYWLMRSAFEPSVVGYGIVCCFIYQGTRRHPIQRVRLHVFVPDNQIAIQRRIDHFLQQQTPNGFLNELKTDGSLSRSYLKHG
jgi:hypothetical protein